MHEKTFRVENRWLWELANRRLIKLDKRWGNNWRNDNLFVTLFCYLPDNTICGSIEFSKRMFAYEVDRLYRDKNFITFSAVFLINFSSSYVSKVLSNSIFFLFVLEFSPQTFSCLFSHHRQFYFQCQSIVV